MFLASCGLLLSLFSFLTVGSCSHACYSINPEPPETCLQLYKEFKHAVTTEINLFNLEELFSPTLDTIPSLANITYVLYYNMSPEVEPCPKSSRDNSTFINVTETRNKSLGWSSTGVYDVISPIKLHILQPRLLQGIMELIRRSNSFVNNNYQNSDLDALLWVGIKPLDGVVLYLNNWSLPCIPTEKQVNSLLMLTTSKLTTYVDTPGVSNGYVLEFKPNPGVIRSILLYTSVCATTLLIMYVVIWKLPKKKVEDFLDHKNAKNVTYGMLFYVFLEFVAMLVLSSIETSEVYKKANETKTYEVHKNTKTVHQNVLIIKLVSLTVVNVSFCIVYVSRNTLGNIVYPFLH